LVELSHFFAKRRVIKHQGAAANTRKNRQTALASSPARKPFGPDRHSTLGDGLRAMTLLAHSEADRGRRYDDDGPPSGVGVGRGAAGRYLIIQTLAAHKNPNSSYARNYYQHDSAHGKPRR
jgi:hypothetical protein